MELKPVTTSSEHKATAERKQTFISKLTGQKDAPVTSNNNENEQA